MGAADTTQPPREVELKFTLSPEALARLEAGPFAGVEAKATDSTYYDTPDRAALSAGYAVRLRKVGRRRVQTVKGGGVAAVARFEDERPATGGALDLEALRDGPLAKAFDLDALAPLFESRIKRRTHEIEADGAVIELALDLGEIVAGAAREPVCELELELKSGGAAALFKAARRLAEGGGLMVSLTSKAERGYRLAEGAPRGPEKFDVQGLDMSGPAGVGFQALMFAALHQLQANVRLLSSRPSLEAVHQARIALRRMRVMIKAFKALASDPETDAIEGRLARMTGVFADARNLDVFIAETFRPYVRDEPGAAEFGEALLHAQAKAHEDVRHALAGEAFAMDALDVLEWVAVGAWTQAALTAAEAGRTLGEVGAEMLKHRRKVMLKRGGRLDWNDPLARHRLRIQAKKMRYLAEVFAPGFGGAKRFLGALEKLQDCLGELNDIASASEVAHLALAAPVSRDAAFAAGALIGARRARSAKLVRKATGAFARFADEAPFWP
jgi:triphosphatase